MRRPSCKPTGGDAGLKRTHKRTQSTENPPSLHNRKKEAQQAEQGLLLSQLKSNKAQRGYGLKGDWNDGTHLLGNACQSCGCRTSWFGITGVCLNLLDVWWHRGLGVEDLGLKSVLG